ncbi:hypothetical protein BDV41DRAFT_516828 [Aspergillus transmontanensis]|uniref:Uncharacterized protein n=1 Tax=Aspergillus transmontanensis TaxID=1034304 RepID=A0A5N6WIN6_9EURO|nr:hypothetical protein BDV41DRAFT_516828 [Aspergillus transmontanensis]
MPATAPPPVQPSSASCPSFCPLFLCTICLQTAGLDRSLPKPPRDHSTDIFLLCSISFVGMLRLLCDQLRFSKLAQGLDS